MNAKSTARTAKKRDRLSCLDGSNAIDISLRSTNIVLAKALQ